MTSLRKMQLLTGRLGVFVKRYARKAQKGVEPNDRRYSTEVAELVKRLPPEELSALLSGDVEAAVPTKKRPKKPVPIDDEVKRNR